MEVDIITPEDPRWARALEGARHEFYDWPDYLALEALRLSGKAVAILAEDGRGSLLIPLILRPVTIGGGEWEDGAALDATSPYGYSGLVLKVAKEGATGFLGDAIEAGTLTLRDAGVIALFVRLHPVLNDPQHFPAFGRLVEQGPSIWIDLELSWEDLQQSLRRRYRTFINSAERDGLTARFDANLSGLDTFLRLYYQTMDRVGAVSRYYFEREYFEGLHAILGDGLKLCLIEDGDRVVCAGLFSASNGIAEYLFSGTDVEAGHPHASKLMMVFVRDWAKKAGCSVFQLGGGLGGREDGLSQFKRGFSKLASPFFTWRLIVDPQRYSEAAEAWASWSGGEPDGLDGFFPSYRKPSEAK